MISAHTKRWGGFYHFIEGGTFHPLIDCELNIVDSIGRYIQQNSTMRLVEIEKITDNINHKLTIQARRLVNISFFRMKIMTNLTLIPQNSTQ